MKKIIVIFVLLALVISGCGNVRKKDNGGEVSISPVKGTNGIVMEFLKKAPPDTIFENSQFPVVVRIKNIGAQAVEEGYLTLSLERDYIEIVKWDLGGNLKASDKEDSILFSLDGATPFNPNGELEMVTASGKTKNIEAQSESHTSLMLATACYRYKTRFGGNACIDTDIFSIRPIRKSCEVSDIQAAGGQGAPVAVTRVETQMLPDDTSDKVRPQFLIHIENSGSGEVIHNERYGQFCTSFDAIEGDALYEDFNIIFVKAFLSEVELDCNPVEDTMLGKVKLKNKKAVARCILSKEEGIDRLKEAYISPLRVELDYGYTKTISREMIIEKALKY